MRLSSPAVVASALVALALAGCETTSTRSCPAFEGHPELGDWAPYEMGDMFTYVNESGGTESYTLVSIDRSEAYEEREFGDREDIVCTLEADYLFESAGADHYLSTDYFIFDREGVPPSDQALLVDVFARAGRASSFVSGARFQYLLTTPTEPGGNDSTDEAQITFSEMREIGQVTYRDVFESIAREEVIDRTTPPEITLTRVVFARGAGLVQFERSDGQVFTRVPP